MLRQRDDPSDALGAAALAPEEEGPAGSRNGGWRGASRWGWQGMAESRLTQLVVLGNVPHYGRCWGYRTRWNFDDMVADAARQRAQ